MNKVSLDYYNEFALNHKNKKVEHIDKKALIYDKPKQKRNYKAFFNFIILISTLSVLIFIASSFSNLLTFTTFSYANNNYLFASNYTVYVVVANEFDNYNQAQELAKEVNLRGGAGFIIDDINYKVALSSYDNLKDAQSVLEKIKNSYELGFIYKMNISNIKINTTTIDDNDIQNILSYFKTSGDKLNGIATKLDLSEISSVEAKKQLLDYYDELHASLLNFDKYISQFKNENMIIVRAKLNQEIENIESIIESDYTNNRFSALIKNGAIKSYLLQNELAQLVV